MAYPTDPLVLAILTEAQWEAVLAGIRKTPAPVPRQIVRLVPKPDVPIIPGDVRDTWRAECDDDAYETPKPIIGRPRYEGRRSSRYRP
ncbi:hypothetical protein NHF48_019855 [Sphingomonas sp. H160509]|uniref:hypothetical protein n=1 Tax=Sphingomonas sp. H160509 TaxID=2955313 RepID=UPI0021E7978E|nr:hypothetical protein [Sphingomonas sp. H160509]MDD1452674.1 hypothetical protein [Sphingomonas sp. H160509]